MTDEVKDAPAQEDKKEGTVKAEAVVKDATISDMLGEQKPEPKKEARMVPEAVLLEYKRGDKELKAEIKELKKMVEEGASKKEVSETLQQIAEEHNVDEVFLQKIVKAAKDEAKKEMEGELESKIKPLEAKERAEKIDKIFNEHFEKTLEANPQYKDIVNKEVIKTLSLDPANAQKTFANLLEETYGKAIPGKKTLETTRARSEQNSDIDFEKARTNGEYFRELMADPESKKKYNEGLAERISKHL